MVICNCVFVVIRCAVSNVSNLCKNFKLVLLPMTGTLFLFVVDSKSVGVNTGTSFVQIFCLSLFLDSLPYFHTVSYSLSCLSNTLSESTG